MATRNPTTYCVGRLPNGVELYQTEFHHEEIVISSDDSAPKSEIEMPPVFTAFRFSGSLNGQTLASTIQPSLGPKSADPQAGWNGIQFDSDSASAYPEWAGRQVCIGGKMVLTYGADATDDGATATVSLVWAPGVQYG